MGARAPGPSRTGSRCATSSGTATRRSASSRGCSRPRGPARPGRPRGGRGATQRAGTRGIDGEGEWIRGVQRNLFAGKEAAPLQYSPRRERRRSRTATSGSTPSSSPTVVWTGTWTWPPSCIAGAPARGPDRRHPRQSGRVHRRRRADAADALSRARDPRAPAVPLHAGGGGDGAAVLRRPRRGRRPPHPGGGLRPLAPRGRRRGRPVHREPARRGRAPHGPRAVACTTGRRS